jgi:hypothetical protein
MKSNKSAQTEVVDEELFLQPWFLPKPTYLNLRRILPSSQLLKMRYYFEDYGCLKCETRNGMYGSNGMCKKCSIVIRGRVVLSLARRFRKIGVKVEKESIKQFIADLNPPSSEAETNSVRVRGRTVKTANGVLGQRR